MVIWGEIQDFNEGKRINILINKEDITQISKPFISIKPVSLPHAILITSVGGEKHFDDFSKNEDIFGLDYALGMFFGYPPQAIQWFTGKESNEDIPVAMGKVRSLTFVFPTLLVEDMLDYYKHLGENLEVKFLDRTMSELKL